MLGDDAAPRIDMAQLPPEAAALITRLQQQVQAQAREIAWRDAKLEKVNFELARLKRWKYGARTEAMTAEQRALFQDTMAEDEASLHAQLAELQRNLPDVPKTPKAPLRKPKRQPLPEHLRRVEHRHEPQDTTCPNPECGQPMQRIARTSARSWTSSRPSSSCTATSTASGPAGAASSSTRSRPSRTWSMAASRRRGWWRTR